MDIPVAHKILYKSNQTDTNCHVWFKGPDDNDAVLLSPEEIANRIGMKHFAEACYYNGEQPEKCDLLNKDPVKNRKIVSIIVKPNNNKLEIRWINKDVGYGLFARESFKRGDAICLYAGIFSKNINNDGYELQSFKGSISAKKIGGVARFIQHMPAKNWTPFLSKLEEFEKMAENASENEKFSSDLFDPLVSQLGYPPAEECFSLSKERFKFYIEKTKKLLNEHLHENDTCKLHVEWRENKLLRESDSAVCFANACSTSGVYQGYLVPYIEASADISEGSQIGYSYGKEFFDVLKIQIKYFKSDGSII